MTKREDIDQLRQDFELLDEDTNKVLSQHGNDIRYLHHRLETVAAERESVDNLRTTIDFDRDEVRNLESRVAALESHNQDDTIQNQDASFKVGDMVLAAGDPSILGLVRGVYPSARRPYLVAWSGFVLWSYHTADGLRPADSTSAQEALDKAEREAERLKRKVDAIREDRDRLVVDADRRIAVLARVRRDKSSNYRYAKEIESKLRAEVKTQEARADKAEARVKELESNYRDFVAAMYEIKEECDKLRAEAKAQEARADKAERERDEARETAHDLAEQVNELRELVAEHEGWSAGLEDQIKRWKWVSDDKQADLVKTRARAEAAEKNAKNATENLAIADQELVEYRAIRDKLVAKLDAVRKFVEKESISNQPHLTDFASGVRAESHYIRERVLNILDGNQ